MSKPIILAIGGAVAGVVVAFAAFTFLMGGGEEVVAAPPTEPVNVPGKLGPHLTLSDRVFNLLPGADGEPVYLKLQTVIEFETKDPAWEYVLNGCGGDSHGARFGGKSDLMVSALPGGAPVSPVEPDEAAAGGSHVDPCEAEEQELQKKFEQKIGSGLHLIEDAVTTIVTGHTVDEIVTPEGKDTLKAEIAHAIDELIHEPHVYRVLFLNFITQ